MMEPDEPLPAPVVRASRIAWRLVERLGQGTASTTVEAAPFEATLQAGERVIPEETPTALSYNGATHAVMMATPCDLEDFATGFSLTEGLIGDASQIEAIDVATVPDLGVDVRIWLPAAAAGEISTSRRRKIVGPVGCGLCGVESLEAANRPMRRVESRVVFSPSMIAEAMASLPQAQRLNRETRAIHAAGFWRPDRGLMFVREDVGRHNALDKLVGAMARSGEPAADGVVLLTSRVSVEMVQKTATLGAAVIVAVSAPTALAVRMADRAGITLTAVARDDGFEVFSHAERIQAETIAP
jgi:FdhD protein